ncbi:MAG TPA: glycine--tRNA ligase subunit beta, partial [Deinococcales bacterium]|nr:glycine--tRNA ligase subunit beta [Deinococcales bacterium]
PERQARSESWRRGPAASVAFGPDGQPTKAGIGFARGAGVEPQALERRLEGKTEHVFARVVDEGQEAIAVLPEILAGLVRTLPAERKMRWGDVETPFSRPISWLLALLGDQVVPFEEAGVRSGRTTRGHRFLAPREAELSTPADYPRLMDELQVTPGIAARREEVLAEAALVVAGAGLELAGTEDLLDEVTNLVERPVALVGIFDPAFLDLPDEVLSTVMIHHQRYFPVRRVAGRLVNSFVHVSNNRVPDESVPRRGLEEVLVGRLADARFFWHNDTARPLSEHRERLKGMVFQKDLGSLHDKAERVASLAPRLAALVGGLDVDALSAALPLFKADLGSQMVYEFPELEGVMGRRYAEREGLAEGPALLLQEGVQPVGPTAPLPATREGLLLAVADRLDTLVGFFSRGISPTGSADPFGLRRAAIAVVRCLVRAGWGVPLSALLRETAAEYGRRGIQVSEESLASLEAFLEDRLEVLLGASGLDVREVRAAAGNGAALLDTARRAWLLRLLRRSEEFAPLAELYKRAANLTKDRPEAGSVDAGALTLEPERRLLDAVGPLRGAVSALLAAGEEHLPPFDPAQALEPSPDTEAALSALVPAVTAVKPVLDGFLDKVLVMSDVPAEREARLSLLAAVRDEIRRLAFLERL